MQYTLHPMTLRWMDAHALRHTTPAVRLRDEREVVEFFERRRGIPRGRIPGGVHLAALIEAHLRGREIWIDIGVRTGRGIWLGPDDFSAPEHACLCDLLSTRAVDYRLEPEWHPKCPLPKPSHGSPDRYVDIDALLRKGPPRFDDDAPPTIRDMAPRTGGKEHSQ